MVRYLIPCLCIALSIGCAKETSTYYQAKKQTIELVNAAVQLIEQDGEQSFSTFRTPDSDWYHGDTYVFVWDMDGNRLVYPPDIEHEKENLKTLKDIDGKPIGELFIAVASSSMGEGWVTYRWPEPHQSEPRLKDTYVKRAVMPEGNMVLVGSGFYQ